MAVSTSWLGKLKKILSRSKSATISGVEVHYDAGFGNALFIRGAGAGLDWEKGIALKNTASDVWVWETDRPFETATFKLLLNDVQYEVGENRVLTLGETIQCTPRF